MNYSNLHSYYRERVSGVKIIEKNIISITIDDLTHWKKRKEKRPIIGHDFSYTFCIILYGNEAENFQ